MRIIAGRFGGRPLASVGKGDPGAHLRPTPDRVRESLFSMLQGGRYGDPVTGAKVLDLFAGTGALGLEALSRGADHVTFIDRGRPALRLLSENIAALGVEAETRVLPKDASKPPRCTGAPCDLVFLDPPYGQGFGPAPALEAGWIRPGALIVWEDRQAHAAPDGFTALEHKRYGDTTITLMEALP